MSGRRPSLASSALALAVVAALAALIGALRPASSDATGDQLPELPSVEERLDPLYDDAGCLRTGPTQVDCETTAGEVDEALAGTATDDERSLAGFSGRGWKQEARRGEVVVLDASVSRADGPGFVAYGLVRNETEAVIGAIEVHAELLDASGEVVAAVTVPAAVGDVRPGEPVPFTVRRPDVDAAAVHDVRWHAAPSAPTADEAAADAAARQLGWTSWWHQPAGPRAPVSLAGHTDPTDGPFPDLLFGSVENHGERSIEAPGIVAAWTVDDQIVAVETAAAVDGDGQAVAALAPGQVADVLVVASGPVAVDAELTVWGAGR